MHTNPFQEDGGFQINQDAQLTLMPLPGGLDSMYLLKKLLSETDDRWWFST